MTKACRTCEQEKPESEFRRSQRSPDGWSRECRTCARARDARYREIARPSGRLRRQQVLHRYGITAEEYDALLAAQGGVCAVCKQPESRTGRSLSVDHCHPCTKVRGLLCDRCNTVLGRVRDDPALLRKLADYILETPS